MVLRGPFVSRASPGALARRVAGLTIQTDLVSGHARLHEASEEMAHAGAPPDGGRISSGMEPVSH